MSVFEPVLVKDPLIDCGDGQVSFAVNKGPASVTTVINQATTATNSAHVYPITINSQDSIVDRVWNWHARVIYTISGTVEVGKRLVNLGYSDAPAQLALQKLCNSMSLDLGGGAVFNIPLNLILDPLNRCLEPEELQAISASTSMPDYFGNYADLLVDPTVYQGQNPFLAYGKNGKLAPRGSHKVVSVVGNTVGAAGAVDKVVIITVDYCERLVISPLVWGEIHQKAGMFGLNKCTLSAQIDATAAQSWKWIETAHNVASPNNKAITNLAFDVSRCYIENRMVSSPIYENEQDALSKRCIVPFSYYDHEQKTGLALPTVAFDAASGAVIDVSQTMSSGNFVLNTVPDRVFIFLRDTQRRGYDAEHYLTIKKITVSFNGRSGLVSGASPEELWRYSVEAGSKQTWEEFSGLAVKNTTYFTAPVGNARAIVQPASDVPQFIGTSGSVLVLDFAKHFGIDQPYICPGVGINCSFSYTIEYSNYSGKDCATVELNTLFMTSGLLVIENGSSSMMKSILSQSDALTATTHNGVNMSDLERQVGGGFFSKIKAFARKHLPSALSMAKQHLGNLKTGNKYIDAAAAMGHTGLEQAGYGISGGAITGAGVHKRIAKHLM